MPDQQIKFNRKQLNNPTPRGISFWGRVYVAIAGAVIGWMQTVSWIPTKVEAVIGSIVGLTITIVTIATPFFGVQTDQKNVPIEDVGTMDTDVSKKTS